MFGQTKLTRRGIFFIVLYLVANLPLMRIISIHNGSTIIAIIGHSPEQFIFLALFFPAAVFLTYKLTNQTIGLQDWYPAIRNTIFWVWLVKRGVIVASSIVICLSIAIVDFYWTTPDFYQRIEQEASKAAELNKVIITSLYGTNSGDTRERIEGDTAFQEKLEALRNIYNDSNNLDPIMRSFEFLELNVVGFIVSLGMWMLYLNLKLLGFARQVDDRKLSEDLKNAIPYGVMIVIVYLFWPPLRSYNIFEVQQVITYQTLNPVNVYGIIALAAIVLIWLYYSRFGSNLLSTVLTIISFLASGALMGIARLTPESLINYFGSGMGFGNLFFITFVVILFYIFASEIFKQVAIGLRA